MQGAWRVVFQPPTGNFIAPGKPNTWKSLGVIEEPFNRPGSGWATGDTAMQSNGHHLGMLCALLIQAIKGLLQVLVEIGDADQTAAPEPGVVGFHAVRDYQPGLAQCLYVIGQVIVQTGAVV